MVETGPKCLLTSGLDPRKGSIGEYGQSRVDWAMQLLLYYLARRVCRWEIKVECLGHESKYFLPSGVFVSLLPSEDTVVEQFDIVHGSHQDVLIQLMGVKSWDNKGTGAEILALHDSFLILTVTLVSCSPWDVLIFAIPDS